MIALDRKAHREAGRGFTLVETLISLVIVATMMAAAAAAVGAAARSRTSQQEMMRGVSLARRLLAEIVQQKYEQPSFTTVVLGPEAGETRATYNDVDDYNGLVESPPAEASGTAVAGFSGWTRSVDVKWADAVTLQPAVAQAETGVKRIVVTVTAPSGRTWSVTALRTKSGIYDKAAASTYPATAAVSLQVGGSSSTAVTSRVNLVNQVP